MEQKVQLLFKQQLNQWQLLRTNCDALLTLHQREVEIPNHHSVRLLFNPSRSVSSFANVSPQAIAQRPCFLCPTNRPAQQLFIPLGDEQHLHHHYSLLCNPFPILPGHLTIAEDTHTPQEFNTRAHDMITLARLLPHKVILFNGPTAGASAPDHLHFQAVDQGHLPLQAVADTLSLQPTTTPTRISTLLGAPYHFRHNDSDQLIAAVKELFNNLSNTTPHPPLSYNCFAWCNNSTIHFALYHRSAHRPSCFTRTDEFRRAISPGAVDVAGIIVCALKEDYEQLTAPEIETIFKEICY